MNKRTRLLAFVALGLAGLFAAGFAIHSIIVKPLRTIDDQIVQLRLKLRSLGNERTSYLAADQQVRTTAQSLLGSKPEDAEAQLGSMLTSQLLQAGLRESDFSRIPAGRRTLPGAFEIGWTVQGEGTPSQVLDFLYLLQADTRLHSLESLALSPAGDRDRIRVRFRYLTLVLNPSPEVKAAARPALALDSPARRRYDSIIRRDLLRPFETAEAQAASPTPAANADPSAVEAQSLRVVSLSSWGTQPEAHLLDTRNQQTRVFHPGEKLLEGDIAAIDYRPLPAPNKPGLLSLSRLVLRLGPEFWAVENGQTLAERRRLNPEEVPPSLGTNAVPTTAAP